VGIGPLPRNLGIEDVPSPNVNKISSDDISGGANTNLDEIFGDVRQPNPSTGGIKAFEQENGQIIRIPDLQVIESGQVVSPLQEGTRYLWLVDNN